MYSSLRLLYSSFLTDSFLYAFYLLSYVCDFSVKVLTKLIGHPYNQWFELCIWEIACSILFSSFSGILFCPFIWDKLLCCLILAASLCLFPCFRESCDIF